MQDDDENHNVMNGDGNHDVINARGGVTEGNGEDHGVIQKLVEQFEQRLDQGEQRDRIYGRVGPVLLQIHIRTTTTDDRRHEE